MISKRALQSRIDVLEHQVDNLQTNDRSRDIVASIHAAREAQDRAAAQATAAARSGWIEDWYRHPNLREVPRCQCCGGLCAIGLASCTYCFAKCHYAPRPVGWTHTYSHPSPTCGHRCTDGVHTDASGRVCSGVHSYNACPRCGYGGWSVDHSHHSQPSCGCGDPTCGRYR